MFTLVYIEYQLLLIRSEVHGTLEYFYFAPCIGGARRIMLPYAHRGGEVIFEGDLNDTVEAHATVRVRVSSLPAIFSRQIGKLARRPLSPSQAFHRTP